MSERKENLLANTLFPRLSKMCSDLQKSRPPAGHGVSIAHSLHICEQKGGGGEEKNRGTKSSRKKIELRVKRSPDLCPASRSIGGASPKVRRQVSTLICCRREWEGKKYEKQFVHSRRSIRTIWITRMSAIETRRDEIGGRGEGGLFLRSNVRRVKSSLRAYKVSRCYRIELEGEEEKREEGKREEDWGRKDRGNKLWKRERVYIYIPVGHLSRFHRPGFESTIFDTDFRRRNPYLERCLGLILGGGQASSLRSSSPCLASPHLSLPDPISVIPLRHGRLKEWRLVARTRGRERKEWKEEGVRG